MCLSNMVKNFASAIIATSAMTFYSYLRSEISTNNFREPQLLNYMIGNLPLGIKDPKSAGWILHYNVGFGFSMVYHKLWKKVFPPNVASRVLFGTIGGIIGTIIWDRVLKKHPNPPEIDRRSFYQHIICAHIIYGLFTNVGYKAVEKTHQCTAINQYRNG